MLEHFLSTAHDDAWSAIFLKGYLKLMSAGMKNSAFSGTEMLAKATRITGTKYKRGQYVKAADDLQTLIDFFQEKNVAEKIRT